MVPLLTFPHFGRVTSARRIYLKQFLVIFLFGLAARAVAFIGIFLPVLVILHRVLLFLLILVVLLLVLGRTVLPVLRHPISSFP